MIPNTSHHFFFGLLLAVTVLAFLIFLPFLTPIVLAGALAVIFEPLHRSISRMFKKGERSSLAALITLAIIVVIVLIPAFFIAGKIYSEVQGMYAFLTDEGSRSQVINTLNDLATRASSAFFGLYPSYSFDSLNVTELLQRGLQWIFANLDTVFTGVTKVFLGTFVMAIALFYLLRDGRELRRQVIALSPLGDDDDERILHKLEQAVYSVFAGSLLVGVIQGIVSGVGYAIFHVPSPALWGSITAVAALIPGVGTSLVMVPAVLYLFFTGSTGYAVGLLIWGVLAVGLIDNFLNPIIVHHGVKIHPFLILISVLGGLAFFGPIGFVLGPLVLAFFFALLEIYRASRTRKQQV